MLALIINQEGIECNMLKRFFKNLSRSFCIYLLAGLNLIHAIQQNHYDWLLWISLALVALSLGLNLASAISGGDANA